MTSKQFPKTIYVSRESDGDESYLVVREIGPNDTAFQEGSTPCAVYSLSGVGNVSVTRKFEWGKAKSR